VKKPKTYYDKNKKKKLTKLLLKWKTSTILTTILAIYSTLVFRQKKKTTKLLVKKRIIFINLDRLMKPRKAAGKKTPFEIPKRKVEKMWKRSLPRVLAGPRVPTPAQQPCRSPCFPVHTAPKTRYSKSRQKLSKPLQLNLLNPKRQQQDHCNETDHIKLKFQSRKPDEIRR